MKGAKNFAPNNKIVHAAFFQNTFPVPVSGGNTGANISLLFILCSLLSICKLLLDIKAPAIGDDWSALRARYLHYRSNYSTQPQPEGTIKLPHSRDTACSWPTGANEIYMYPNTTWLTLTLSLQYQVWNETRSKFAVCAFRVDRNRQRIDEYHAAVLNPAASLFIRHPSYYRRTRTETWSWTVLCPHPVVCLRLPSSSRQRERKKWFIPSPVSGSQCKIYCTSWSEYFTLANIPLHESRH